MQELAATPDIDLGQTKPWQKLSVTTLIFSVKRTPLVLWDIVAVFLAFHVFARWSPYPFAQFQAESLFFSIVLAISFAGIGMVSGFYDRTQRFVLSNITAIGLINGLLAFALSTVATYFWFYSTFGRLTVSWGFIGSMAVLLGSRMAMRAWVIANPYKFTVLGHSALLNELSDKSGDESNRLYQYVPIELPTDNPNTIIAKLMEHQVGVLAIGSGVIDDHAHVELAMTAFRCGIQLVDEIEFYSEIFERIPVEAVSKRWVLLEGIGQRRFMFEAVQRGIDITISALSLIALAPLLALITLLIRLTSKGPAFFIQPRMGRYGVPFRMYKFRTMYHSSCDASAKQGFTQQCDSRVTWIGRWLRPLHLDELPQLLNILIGDMSIVGPRPEAVPFARKMAREIPLYELRYLVRPGLTGHAQLMHGYALDNAEETKRKLSYDLYYLTKYSALLNMRLIFRTIPSLAKGAR